MIRCKHVILVLLTCVMMARCGQMIAIFSGVIDENLRLCATAALAMIEQYLILNNTVNVLFKYGMIGDSSLATTTTAWCPGLSYGYVYMPASLYVQLGGNVIRCFAATTPVFYHMTVVVSKENIRTSEYDLITVLMHEICHGLGITSFVRADGTSQFTPYVSLYDKLLFSLTTTSPFVRLNHSLIDGTIKYPFSSLDYPIYSREPFVAGASLVHGQYGLMKYTVMPGKVFRSMDAYVLRILSDMGYTTRNCDTPDTSNVCMFCQSNIACDLSGALRPRSFLFE